MTGCQDLEKPLSCKASSVYKMAVDCERNFLKKFMSNEKADCGYVKIRTYFIAGFGSYMLGCNLVRLELLLIVYQHPNKQSSAFLWSLKFD